MDILKWASADFVPVIVQYTDGKTQAELRWEIKISQIPDAVMNGYKILVTYSSYR